MALPGEFLSFITSLVGGKSCWLPEPSYVLRQSVGPVVIPGPLTSDLKTLLFLFLQLYLVFLTSPLTGLNWDLSAKTFKLMWKCVPV